MSIPHEGNITFRYSNLKEIKNIFIQEGSNCAVEAVNREASVFNKINRSISQAEIFGGNRKARKVFTANVPGDNYCNRRNVQPVVNAFKHYASSDNNCCKGNDKGCCRRIIFWKQKTKE